MIRGSPQKKVVRRVWNRAKTDLEVLNEDLRKKLVALSTVRLESIEDVDATVEMLQDILTRVMESRIPWNRVCCFSKNLWNTHITKVYWKNESSSKRMEET